jgi:hypothetical protein
MLCYQKLHGATVWKAMSIAFATVMFAVAAFTGVAHAKQFAFGTMVEAESGLCVTPFGDSETVAGRAWLEPCDGRATQNWYRESAALGGGVGTGFFRLKNWVSGRCLGRERINQRAPWEVRVGSCDMALPGIGNPLQRDVTWYTVGDLFVGGTLGPDNHCIAKNSGDEYYYSILVMDSVDCDTSFKNPMNWGTLQILVHGYASDRIRDQAARGAGDPANFWYWRGNFSNGQGAFNVRDSLFSAADADGAFVRVLAANWDGKSAIAENSASVANLIALLNLHCTGAQTCDLIGHSTGDMLIGYVLDKFQERYRWNVRNVFVAGGAGGGTQAASWMIASGSRVDPVIRQLVPTTAMALYNHNMRRNYADVPNIRFVGAGKMINDPGAQNILGINYAAAQAIIRGNNDGLVPFSSQAGVSAYIGETLNQYLDAYCLKKVPNTDSTLYACGQVNFGKGPAYRPSPSGPSGNDIAVNLFAGYKVQFLDWGRFFNHSDEVGYLGKWIAQYRQSSTEKFKIVSMSNNARRCLDTLNLDGPVRLTHCDNNRPSQWFYNDGSGRLKSFEPRDNVQQRRCLQIVSGKNENGQLLESRICQDLSKVVGLNLPTVQDGNTGVLFDLGTLGTNGVIKFPVHWSRPDNSRYNDKGRQRCWDAVDGGQSTRIWDCVDGRAAAQKSWSLEYVRP